MSIANYNPLKGEMFQILNAKGEVQNDLKPVKSDPHLRSKKRTG